ncbi:MAG: cytochrome ubiquinol oxidase subunit I [Gemmatimonadota bacterium]|nr:MAG: cytochrome ubiquinol oxidase subunit I [Gemmatimonadota bacterium]
MDPVLLSRIQFAITAGFHFIFPPISIGLAWLLVVVEGRAWRSGDEAYVRMGKLFGKLLAFTFAIGVATGILLEFQFGTNWARYSKFVGDIFGAPLAAEGVFAFFLESTFLGLYLFGRSRVPKMVHWLSILMVAVGATISAFWIIVANSWQQTPAGYAVRHGRAELESFWAAVFNPSTLPRYFHTIFATLVVGAFVMAGVAAYRLLRNREDEIGKRALKLSVPWGLVAAILVAFPFGHWHAQQVAETQPEKFAAIEGLYTSQAGAPLVLFAFVHVDPPELRVKVEVPGLLSWMAFGDPRAPIRGIDEFPDDEVPPLWLTFVSFHNMVVLGLLFIAVMAWGAVKLWRQRLFAGQRFLKLLVWIVPLPVIACQFGWVAAEVGRQPWIVYQLLRTSDAHSQTVSAGEVLFSIVLFGVIYLLLGALWVHLMVKEAGHDLEPAVGKEVMA